MTVKYLTKRGRVYSFSRRVPDDVRPVVGSDHWRESLKTDSLTEAEIRCRKRAVETDELIASVRSGTFRKLSDVEIDDLMVKWQVHFINHDKAAIPYFVYPHLEGPGEFVHDRPSPIYANRNEVEQAVRRWATEDEIDIEFGSADWNALIDECVDAYLIMTPELSSGWKDVFASNGHEELAAPFDKHIEIVERQSRIPESRRLSYNFEQYAKQEEIGESAYNDFGVGVRRFIELHGDLDVAKIERSHAHKFRDKLRLFPSRPPNEVRKLTFVEQVEWARDKDVPLLAQPSINKNLGGVKRTLDYVFNETSSIENRGWTNPFQGFARKPKKSGENIRAFSAEQIGLVFSDKIHKSKNLETFWIPLVLFYTGARLDEICQLHVEDVRIAPLPHIVCENMDDEDPANSKKVKSLSSNRSIPIHANLIELGFMEYVAHRRESDALHLFPELPHGRGKKRGDKISRGFMRRFREFGKANPETELDTKKLVTHSLRHTFRTAGFRGGIEQEFLQVVMGQHVGGVSFATDLRPTSPPAFGRIRILISGLMRPAFATSFWLRTHSA